MVRAWDRRNGTEDVILTGVLRWEVAGQPALKSWDAVDYWAELLGVVACILQCDQYRGCLEMDLVSER